MEKKNKKWTYEEKKKIVEEKLEGRSYTYLAEKYNIKSPGMIANWKKKYAEGTLEQDNRGRRKTEYDEYEILKKSYALLMEIRSKSNQ